MNNLLARLGYGLREDGSMKGSGYFGELPSQNGSVATEKSIGVNIDGKEQLIPAINPFNSPNVNYQVAQNNQSINQDVIRNAVLHAKERMKQKKSPFYQEGEARPYDPSAADATSYDKPVPEVPVMQDLLLGVLGGKVAQGAIGGVGGLLGSMGRTAAQEVSNIPSFVQKTLVKDLPESFKSPVTRSTFKASGNRTYDIDTAPSRVNPEVLRILNLNGQGSSGGLGSIAPDLKKYYGDQGFKAIDYLTLGENAVAKQRMFQALMNKFGIARGK